MNVYPHHPLYHIPLPKRKKESLRVLKLLKVLLGKVLYSFLSDRVLLSVLSYRILLESSVIGSSSGSSAIDSSVGSSVLFFRHAAIFYQNVLLLFFIKNRCSALHYIFKKNFTVKGTLSGPRQSFATECPLKMMKNAFYFASKVIFVLQIFKFLS